MRIRAYVWPNSRLTRLFMMWSIIQSGGGTGLELNDHLCTAVAAPVGLLREPAAGRADAKAARHGRPTAARKR